VRSLLVNKGDRLFLINIKSLDLTFEILDRSPLNYLSALPRHFEVLLLDEFTALLDPDSQLNLVPAVQGSVKNCGQTALWVTHPLDELNYCDRAFLLEKCEVLDRGDPPRLKQRLMQIQEV
jgi:energy-coupling factor transport system ATP-binding protein